MARRTESLLRQVDVLRTSHYLDGPNDIDWIFRNEIEARREELLYVDYVSSDDGDRWQSAQQWDIVGIGPPSTAVELVGAMHRTGFSTPAGLQIVTDVWNRFVPKPETPWSDVRLRSVETLERLTSEIDVAPREGDLRRIITSWTFPLWNVDLGFIKVDLNGLRQQQEAWHPDVF